MRLPLRAALLVVLLTSHAFAGHYGVQERSLGRQAAIDRVDDAFKPRAGFRALQQGGCLVRADVSMLCELYGGVPEQALSEFLDAVFLRKPRPKTGEHPFAIVGPSGEIKRRDELYRWCVIALASRADGRRSPIAYPTSQDVQGTIRPPSQGGFSISHRRPNLQQWRQIIEDRTFGRGTPTHSSVTLVFAVKEHTIPVELRSESGSDLEHAMLLQSVQHLGAGKLRVTVEDYERGKAVRLELTLDRQTGQVVTRGQGLRYGALSAIRTLRRHADTQIWAAILKDHVAQDGLVHLDRLGADPRFEGHLRWLRSSVVKMMAANSVGFLVDAHNALLLDQILLRLPRADREWRRIGAGLPAGKRRWSALKLTDVFLRHLPDRAEVWLAKKKTTIGEIAKRARELDSMASWDLIDGSRGGPRLRTTAYAGFETQALLEKAAARELGDPERTILVKHTRHVRVSRCLCSAVQLLPPGLLRRGLGLRAVENIGQWSVGPRSPTPEDLLLMCSDRS